MKTKILVRLACLILVIFGAAALVPRVAGRALAGVESGAPAREIHLVVKDMTFYVEGDTTPNPTLRARAGEHVRLVLRNTDPGMVHDFTIQSWSVGTRLLKGKGEDSIEFTVPNTRGAHVYSCTPHSAMMGGTIEVQ
jgi:plastocyanin